MQAIIFKEKREVAEETFLYTFTRPEGYVFEAGQYATVRLPETMPHPDNRGNARAFSFASAPYESDLGFMMRDSESGFKQNMQTLQEGDEVYVSKAIGKCTLSCFQDAKPLIIICGGVGYTPVRALLRQMIYENLVTPTIIFNPNRRPETAPECEWLSSVGRDREHITVINTMTDLPKGRAGCEDCRGRIDADMLNKFAPDAPEAIYFVVAGADFITSMREVLQDLKIPDERVFFDNFG